MISIKRFFLSIVFLLSLTVVGFAQSPVEWKYSAEKLGNNVYKIILTANIQEPWKIYSQQSPEGGPLPTTISFSKNPLVTLQDSVKEEGELHKYFEEVFGVDVYSYAGTVKFVQMVKLKNKLRTRLRGSIEYMACTDEQCLPPATEEFSIELGR